MLNYSSEKKAGQKPGQKPGQKVGQNKITTNRVGGKH